MEIALTLSAFVFTMAGQFVLARSALPGSGVMKYAGLVVVAGLALAAILWQVLGTELFTLLACVALFGFLCELYLFLFTMVTSSVSVRLLRTLRNRSMQRSEIEKLYDSRTMVSQRLERMKAVGLLNPASLEVTTRGRILVRAFTFLKKAFRHPLPTDDVCIRRAA
jgi:hypothetical protein